MIKHFHHSEQKLWLRIGAFFADKNIRKELGDPMNSDDNYHWFVSIDNNDTVNGFAAIELKKSGAWFRHSYVFEASRNNGVYGELLTARMNFCRQQGDAIIPMITCVATSESLPSLLKLNFRPIANRGKYTTLRLKL